ncbi:MAG: hypothetical protein Q8Q33_04735, partial [Chlamydiota bacterium]|nr:hypothetical protein [Chlamydiota bacterium]
RAFEMFMKILRPPIYGSIDPTPFFAFFFPIFFGIIMGDMGYGLVFLFIGLTLRLRTKKITLQYISEIILVCAFYTILFGFIYAEFFGDWLERYHILYPLSLHIGATTIELNRLHALMPLLIMAISIGVFHVILGFLLKLYHSLKHKHHHESIEVVLILITLASLFALIAVLAHSLPALFKMPSVVALLIAIPVLVFMKGPMMLIELLSFVGNMLSYARIMAIGTASAYLAFVANMLGGLTGNIILGGIIVILFHIINMILAFSPIIQSARLHYVEFFSKFYEPGGYHYNPLNKKGGEYQ